MEQGAIRIRWLLTNIVDGDYRLTTHSALSLAVSSPSRPLRRRRQEKPYSGTSQPRQSRHVLLTTVSFIPSGRLGVLRRFVFIGKQGRFGNRVAWSWRRWHQPLWARVVGLGSWRTLCRPPPPPPLFEVPFRNILYSIYSLHTGTKTEHPAPHCARGCVRPRPGGEHDPHYICYGSYNGRRIHFF